MTQVERTPASPGQVLEKDQWSSPTVTESALLLLREPPVHDILTEDGTYRVEGDRHAAPGESSLIEKVTQDRGVLKSIVQDGEGHVVPMHAVCLVHYVGRILSNGEIFMNTLDAQEKGRGEPVHLVAGRDAIRKEKGLHQVVATMKIGEICHAWVSPEYGYGAEGNFSFPSIPPGATLSYSIQLIDFESPKSGDGSDSLGFLTYEERLEAAKRRRLEGNDLYSSGQLQHAMGKYESALAFLDEDFMMQLYEFHYDKAMEERVNVLLNVSACRLKQEKYHQVIEVTTQVISHDGSHIKALYRRGMARRKLGQTAAALEDLEQAKCISEKASPDGRADVAILREIVSARKDLQDQSRAQGVLYKNMIRVLVEKTVAKKARKMNKFDVKRKFVRFLQPLDRREEEMRPGLIKYYYCGVPPGGMNSGHLYGFAAF